MRGVVLSGCAGTGKTTIGPLVAAKLSLPFVDTDSEIATRAGASVPDLWERVGEKGFRELEARLVSELFADGRPRVLAFGGGTVTSRSLRHLALERSLVVTLTARSRVLLERIGKPASRPILSGPDVEARLDALLAERTAVYAECHLRVATDQLSPSAACELIAKAWAQTSVVVPLGTRSYRVTVDNDAPAALTDALTSVAPSSLVVVSDRNVRACRGAALEQALAPLQVRITSVTLEPGEEHKTLASVSTIWDAALEARVDRQSVVLAFGGGVVGDLAAFAASTLLRGLPVVHAPTSLLAMVDASVGGKTGFDVPSGKNLLGSFHQPSAVVIDLVHLSTLPRRDFVAGLAEVAKVALACDEALWVSLEEQAEALASGNVRALAAVVERCIDNKARLVRDDETDTGARALLNLGHTVGHGLEVVGGYRRYRHGEAVALGLVAECLVAERRGTAAVGLTARVSGLLKRLGLPTELPHQELAEGMPALALDKKRAGGLIVMPLVQAPGHARVEALSLRELAEALRVGVPG